MQREGIIQQIFEATFPNGTTASGLVNTFQRPTEALIQNFFNESFRVIGNTPVSGEVRPVALVQSTVVPAAELGKRLMGDTISYIDSLLDDFIREQLAPLENVVFANPTVSGVSVTESGSDLAISVTVIASSGVSFSAEPLPNQFFDPSGVQEATPGLARGVSLDFTSASGYVFTMYHGLNTNRFVWDMWTTETTPDCTVRPENVVNSGLNHVTIQLDVPMDGYINLIGIGV